jgi:hypothetical protein
MASAQNDTGTHFSIIGTPFRQKLSEDDINTDIPYIFCIKKSFSILSRGAHHRGKYRDLGECRYP